MKFLGNITVEVENRGIGKNLHKPVTKREDIKPLLDTDWLPEINGTTPNFESTTNPIDQTEKDRKTTNFEKFENEPNDKRLRD